MQDLDKELLVYNLLTNKAYCLNKTAALVYQSADGTKSASELAAILSKELKSQVTEEFVLFTLNELKNNDLLENYGLREPEANRRSRREMIKRIGLSTAVALPVISMLVAPTAANAQSAGACLSIGQSCALPGSQCCSGSFCNNIGLNCVSNSCGVSGAFCIRDASCCNGVCVNNICL